MTCAVPGARKHLEPRGSAAGDRHAYGIRRMRRQRLRRVWPRVVFGAQTADGPVRVPHHAVWPEFRNYRSDERAQIVYPSVLRRLRHELLKLYGGIGVAREPGDAPGPLSRGAARDVGLHELIDKLRIPG